MKHSILAAALALAAPLGAAAQLQNLVPGTPLSQIAGGQYISGTVQVLSSGGTRAYIGIAIGDATDAAPSASAFWIAGDSTPPASGAVHSCPSPGWWDGHTQPASPAWHMVNIGAWMPYAIPNCSAKKFFIVAAQDPGLDMCGYDAIIAVPFTVNTAAGCATATPTRTPALTATRTPTPAAGTSTRTPTPGTPPTHTVTRTPTDAPTAVPPVAGPAAEPVRVVRAVMFPNPNPSRVSFDLRGAPDEVRVSVYTSAYALAWEGSVPGQPAGWRSVPLSFPAPGTYFVKVEAFSGGAARSSFSCAAMALR